MRCAHLRSRRRGRRTFATHLRDKLADNPNSLIVSAGDNIGATPLLSALFHDEPTIEALSKAGLAISSVGNHEFDEGVTELLRMQNGGCHPVDGCADGDGFDGAGFKYLSANVVSQDGRDGPSRRRTPSSKFGASRSASSA